MYVKRRVFRSRRFSSSRKRPLFNRSVKRFGRFKVPTYPRKYGRKALRRSGPRQAPPRLDSGGYPGGGHRVPYSRPGRPSFSDRVLDAAAAGSGYMAARALGRPAINAVFSGVEGLGNGEIGDVWHSLNTYAHRAGEAAREFAGSVAERFAGAGPILAAVPQAILAGGRPAFGGLGGHVDY